MDKNAPSLNQADLIDGVHIQDLKVVQTDNGAVYHMLRASNPLFMQFGEIYFSKVHKNAIKGWHQNKKKVNHFAVPVGEIQLVIYDDRKESPTYRKTMDLILGETHYKLIRIPVMVWYSFKGLSSPFALVANCATHEHEEGMANHLPISNEIIPYRWS